MHVGQIKAMLIKHERYKLLVQRLLMQLPHSFTILIFHKCFILPPVLVV